MNANRVFPSVITVSTLQHVKCVKTDIMSMTLEVFASPALTTVRTIYVTPVMEPVWWTLQPIKTLKVKK